MNKFKSFMENFKKNMFFYIIVWLVVAILFVVPFIYTRTNAVNAGTNWVTEIMEHYIDNFLEFPITKMLEEEYWNDFVKGIGIFSVIYWILVIIGINKTLPKSAFDKIEHGSSDWCAPGEQYKILSKKNGLILAKDNYLPIDKSGNVNVLIVGRIWCW